MEMNSSSDWPHTNAHFFMIETTVKTLEKEGEEISQQKLGEKVGEEEESVSGSTAEKYLSNQSHRKYWREEEPMVRLEKPEGSGGRSTVYWIYEKHFDEKIHGRYKRWNTDE
jgi:hypothetical protein